MKQAIDFSLHHDHFLTVGSRRKSHHSFMLMVTQGCAFVRLGKEEYAVKAGAGFYVPFDCLHAITVLPETQYRMMAYSARLTTPLCREAGYFRVNALIKAVCDELTVIAKLDKPIKLEGESGNLLRVMADQAAKLSVQSKTTAPGLDKHSTLALLQILNGQSVTDLASATSIQEFTGYSVKEIESCILMREAFKLSRSGRKLEQIAKALKQPAEIIAAMAQPILGQSL